VWGGRRRNRLESGQMGDVIGPLDRRMKGEEITTTGAHSAKAFKDEGEEGKGGSDRKEL